MRDGHKESAQGGDRRQRDPRTVRRAPHDDAWIQMLGRGEETAELLAVYEEFKIPPDQVDHILKIHSLDPPSLRGHMLLYRTLMFGPSPLSRAERETLAVTVSVVNRCHY